jgi:hypothetical protein
MSADDSIPQALRARRQWVAWRIEMRKGKETKVPYRPDAPLVKGETDNPQTWGTYEDARAVPDVDGQGYVFSGDDPYTGLDFDHCIDSTTREIHPVVADVVRRLSSYAELSPSRTGVHCIIEAELRSDRHVTNDTPWGGKFEVYDRGRFFTVTGRLLQATPGTIESRQAELDRLCVEFFPPSEPASPSPAAKSIPASDRELIDRAHRAANGRAFAALWRGDVSGHGNDDSAADLALLSHLGFWTGRDPERMDQLFRQTGLYRQKWERPDYRDRTIAKALSGAPPQEGPDALEPLDAVRERQHGGSPICVEESGGKADEDNSGENPERVGESGEKGSETGSRGLSSTSLHISEGSVQSPAPLGAAAYCGLAGEVVSAFEPHTEADPAALLASVLVGFGNAVGRGPHFLAGDALHATNLYVCVIGETGTGRKGTSAEPVRRLIEAADLGWSGCIKSGLVSGEGLIHHVRDPRIERRKPKKGEEPDAGGMVEDLVDAGVEDKRLLALVPEFAQILGVIERRDNTLSAVLRDLWDRGDVQTLAKNSPERATGALVSIVAHVTPIELRARLNSTEIANGFANRFMFVASKRSRLLPRGGSIPAGVLDDFAALVTGALKQARMRLNEVGMTDQAWELWDERYESLTTRPPGLVGAVTGRAAPIVRRLALIYALMDERPAVHEEHLRAALELWRYVEQTVRWVFGDRLGERIADQCLALLREVGNNGMTRTELRGALGHRVAADRITDGLRHLEEAGLARHVDEPTGGRNRERWYSIREEEQRCPR